MSNVSNARLCNRRINLLLNITLNGCNIRVDFKAIQDRTREYNIIPLDGLLLIAYLEHDYPIINEIKEDHPYVYRRIAHVADTIASMVGDGSFNSKKIKNEPEVMDRFMLKNMSRVVH